MRTSLNEAAQIENWLLQHGDVSDRLVMEAKMLSNSEVQEKVKWQSTTYELARHHGREKLYKDIKSVEHRLFNKSKYRSFQYRIKLIFNR